MKKKIVIGYKSGKSAFIISEANRADELLELILIKRQTGAVGELLDITGFVGGEHNQKMFIDAGDIEVMSIEDVSEIAVPPKIFPRVMG